MRVGLFIPAFNAAHTLAAVVARIPDTLRPRLGGIWIINDGSTDGTAAAAEALARRDPLLQVIHLDSNRGYGGAAKAGLKAIRAAGLGPAICIHADGQYAPEELPEMLRALAEEELDLLQGSRLASGTALSGGMPLYKYLAGRALTAMENRTFGLRMSDYHSGYLVYGERALARLSFARFSDSFDFDLEVIAGAAALGLRVGERPIPTHYGDEESHLNPITYGLRVLRVMARYKLGHYHQGT